MEQEYKWKMPSLEVYEKIKNSAFLKKYIKSQPRKILMKADYYDTADYFLRKNLHAALRLRCENNIKVCCLKIPCGALGNCFKRLEYEVLAANIQEGIEKLKSAGVQAGICVQLQKLKLKNICSTYFERNAYEIEIASTNAKFNAELCFDFGQAIKGLKKAIISEIELEFKCGNLEFFHAWGLEFANLFNLEVQSMSKLAQALGLD